MNNYTSQSIKALVIGFISVAFLSIITDIILERIGVLPPQTQPALYIWWMLLLALVYRSFFTVFGGYIAAKLAPRKPIHHAVILGLIGMIFATLGAIANWNKSTGQEWYPVLLIFISLPATWLGGKMQTMTIKKEVKNGRK